MAEKPQNASQRDWEDEGGAPAPEPKQTTPEGAEISIPKRREFKAALRKMFQSDKPKRKH